MMSRISSKGQIVLPAEFRQLDKIEPGQEFDIQRVNAGEYLLKKKSAGGSVGLTDWLLSCPAKGWFQPIESESTDTL